MMRIFLPCRPGDSKFVSAMYIGRRSSITHSQMRAPECVWILRIPEKSPPLRNTAFQSPDTGGYESDTDFLFLCGLPFDSAPPPGIHASETDYLLLLLGFPLSTLFVVLQVGGIVTRVPLLGVGSTGTLILDTIPIARGWVVVRALVGVGVKHIGIGLESGEGEVARDGVVEPPLRGTSVRQPEMDS